MSVILVASSKGGVGKSTIARHIARSFQLSGSSVAMLDLDPDGSTMEFFKDSGGIIPSERTPTLIGVDSALRRLQKKTDVVVIDGLAKAGHAVTFGVAQSDLVIIPVQAEISTIRGAISLAKVLRDRHQITGSGKPQVRFLMNRLKKGTNITMEMVNAKAGPGGFPYMRTVIWDWTAIQEASNHGKTVLDYDVRSSAVADFAALTDEIIRILN